MAASRTQPRVGKKRKGKKIEKSVEKGGIAGPKVHRKPAGFSAFSVGEDGFFLSSLIVIRTNFCTEAEEDW